MNVDVIVTGEDGSGPFQNFQSVLEATVPVVKLSHAQISISV